MPKTLTITIAVQYTHATYRRIRSCTPSATTSATPPSPTAGTGPSRRARKSEVVSPIPVVSTFVTQNSTVTWGTLLTGSRTGVIGSTGRM
ncbi:hypothetical protein GCM10009665_61750 [Kitasatospora nipponensis]|uniref:Uncharacterized protein n=1 Tax=Kitasatospora nipponensis TaxID=258049 RepID=A0ABN1WVB7_9ACTN